MDTASDKPSYWFIFQNNCLLVTIEDNQPRLLTSQSITLLNNELIRQYSLGKLEQFDIYCGEIDVKINLPKNINSIPFKKALEVIGLDWYSLAAKAFAIINWDKHHQFCGGCGNVTTHKTGSFERICSVCGLTFYPRISPSIIVLIHKNDQILMARGHHFIPGAYGLIAGFVEAGESVEEAVFREVAEEVGIKITNLRYFGSQSWPFPDSLMIAFTAEYASGELKINHTEIETAGWYAYDQLPGGPSSSLSIARKLIDHFIAEQKNKAIKNDMI